MWSTLNAYCCLLEYYVIYTSWLRLDNKHFFHHATNVLATVERYNAFMGFKTDRKFTLSYLPPVKKSATSVSFLFQYTYDLMLRKKSACFHVCVHSLTPFLLESLHKFLSYQWLPEIFVVLLFWLVSNMADYFCHTCGGVTVKCISLPKDACVFILLLFLLVLWPTIFCYTCGCIVTPLVVCSGFDSEGLYY